MRIVQRLFLWVTAEFDLWSTTYRCYPWPSQRYPCEGVLVRGTLETISYAQKPNMGFSMSPLTSLTYPPLHNFPENRPQPRQRRTGPSHCSADVIILYLHTRYTTDYKGWRWRIILKQTNNNVITRTIIDVVNTRVAFQYKTITMSICTKIELE